ncbi:HalOD1 output domain-containing protein [Salinilacihabitans rarus]|uniref:HalOD1 output domain-containing protein n=1 Tax=Salinilacihabitans rarus TaxID=2961596 RepID=UPI0020C8F07C|nr:HalOD1 output domain-containing protein [Salinilacihabitans rarus]
MGVSGDAPAAGERSPSRAVVEAVAEREGVDVTDVEPPTYDPLYAVVNPEALDRLLAGRADVTLEFVYEGYEVVVRGDGRVDLSETGSGNEFRLDGSSGDHSAQ